MPEKTRPCTFETFGETREGEFHTWGNQLVYDDGNHPHARMIGVVEDKKKGQVFEVEPHKIRFKD